MGYDAVDSLTETLTLTLDLRSALRLSSLTEESIWPAGQIVAAALHAYETLTPAQRIDHQLAVESQAQDDRQRYWQTGHLDLTQETIPCQRGGDSTVTTGTGTTAHSVGIHYADLGSSPRLQRVHELLKTPGIRGDGWHTTLAIQTLGLVCCAATCVSELRHNGIPIESRPARHLWQADSRPWEYRISTDSTTTGG
jgi:hypothetical protein